MRVVVLGAGRVGWAMARDLAGSGEFQVRAVDRSPESLARLAGVAGVETERAELTDPAQVTRAIRDADLVVGAVPGDLGFATVRTVLEAGKHMVDISFFPEDPLLLDAVARERGVTAVVDCGVAPGCDNVILGRLLEEMERVDRFACFVGGLPVERHHPWEYKAPFSPMDVLAEYTRPARLRRCGQDVSLPALSETELLDFPGVGTLEAFLTDGLRTLLATTQVPTMVEKTLRYPGHAEKIRLLRDAGFLSTQTVELDGVGVRPIDLTARLLFPAWQLATGEEDLTVLRVEVEGLEGGRPVRRRFDLLDRYDRASGTTSMARTTGYTCTAVARMVARGLFTRRGVSPPEVVGRDAACYEFLFAELAARGIVFRQTKEPLAAG
ncbi:MAG: saccharopine dehydrogenase NADP-binding domain-containing protein [Thermoanaerobaculaceae bacterium]|nr:saccharopine dehydrogenase NADP-binding domain-containing protein [Thermoanaerobaculaceae bacterium]